MNDFDLAIAGLTTFCILLGFILGWLAKLFYDKYVREIDEECDDIEYEEDEE